MLKRLTNKILTAFGNSAHAKETDSLSWNVMIEVSPKEEPDGFNSAAFLYGILDELDGHLKNSGAKSIMLIKSHSFVGGSSINVNANYSGGADAFERLVEDFLTSKAPDGAEFRFNTFDLSAKKAAIHRGLN